MKIAIYGRKFSDKTTIPYVQQVVDCLEAANVPICIFDHFYKFISGFVKFTKQPSLFSSYADIKNETEVMLSLGGDGTMLDTVRLVRDSNIPVIGINLGRLGFLASINKDDIDRAIRGLLERNYTLDSRTLIKVESESKLFGQDNYALNDVTMHRRDYSAMMHIHAYLNGDFLNSYWADGLIIATPTGSTAYSLSCGGPILFPSSSNFVITPVSAHNLNVRPIVLSDSNVLSFELEGRNAKYLLSCDSRTELINHSTKISIRKADFQFNMIRLNNESYLKTLRNKMLWGIDTRNY